MPSYFGFLAEGIQMPVDADYFSEFYKLGLEVMGVEDSGDAAAECVGKYGFSPRALAGLGYSEQVVSASVIFRQDGSRFVIDIDTSTDQMVWRGIGSGQIDRTKEQDEQIQGINEAVQEILKKFPPE